jgi:phosphatidylinositol 4-kinase B
VCFIVLDALRRFDSPIKGESTILTPTPDKNMVELLVTNVVAKHLHLPNLVSTEEGNEDAVDEAEKGTVGDEKIKADVGETDGKVEVLSNGGSDNSQELRRRSKKMSALGGFFSGESGSSLAKTGDTRREVLTTIMTKGMKGSNPIAAGAATAVQRQLKELERRRAIELLLTGEEPTFSNSEDGVAKGDNVESTRQELLSLGISSGSSDDLVELYNSRQPTDEDEAMEAVRLLLIQYQVAQGQLSLGDAAEVLAPTRHKSPRIQGRGPFGRHKKPDPREMPQVDAGDVDARLVGCGVLPPAVLQALTLWKGSMVTNGELLELVKKDLEYVRHSFQLEDKRVKLSEDSAFWGRFAFGERWAEKAARIAATSPEGSQPGWDLLGVIIKSNDDLRQETFVMQLIELCREAFHEAGLELWLHPYRILSTGRSTGIIEMVRNAMSFDALKKRPGYGKGGLREHLQRMTDYAADPGEAFKSAQRNFVRSLASYSLLSYLFLFKDRHNGNILLDTAGHVIHIDFGFVLGVAPGGSFSLEMSTPFKLTEEMIEVMDGLRSSLFSEFVTLFCCGFLALQAHCDIFLTIVEITCKGSTFKCFEGRDSAEVVESLRERFCPDLGKEDTIAFALDIIKQATNSYGTAQYDYFQYLSQGIAT